MKKNKEDEKEKSKETLDSKKSKVIDSIWKIKTEYTGEERKTDQFFYGLKSDKNAFFNYILGISKPSVSLSKSIEDIKKRTCSNF